MPYGVLDPTTAAAAPSTTIGEPASGVGLTLEALRTELNMAIGDRVDLDSGHRLDLWVNLGYVDMATSLRLDELRASMLINIVQGQSLYKLPACVGTTIGAAVVDTTNYRLYGGRPLEKIDLDEWRKRLDIVGEIESYFRYGELLVVWPTPMTDRPVALDFRVRPLFLVEDNDSPILPIEWHEGVLLNAKVKAYDGLEEPEHVLTADASYTKFLAKRLDAGQEEDINRMAKSAVIRSDPGLYRSRVLPRHRSS